MSLTEEVDQFLVEVFFCTYIIISFVPGLSSESNNASYPQQCAKRGGWENGGQDG
jgi:hypothetical protein